MKNNIRVTAKKSLGQNFLVNEGVLDRMVAAAEITPDDTVLEVGPGTGALTRRLATTGARIIAIEKDARLIGPLREHFANVSNVEIVEADILRFDISNRLAGPGSYKVVANIPYYLTSHLLRLMLERWPSPSLAVLMVQNEVAARILASPPDMNLLALSVQLYAIPSRVMRVSRGSFRPTPDVDSAVIRLDIGPRTESIAATNARVLELAKRAFVQKRKQLKATIPPDMLIRARIEPSTRPQELSTADWLRLTADLP